MQTNGCLLDMTLSQRYNEAMNKSTSKHPRFSAYIPARVLEGLERQAYIDRRSVNGQLVWYLECGLQGNLPQERTAKEVELEQAAKRDMVRMQPTTHRPDIDLHEIVPLLFTDRRLSLGQRSVFLALVFAGGISGHVQNKTLQEISEYINPSLGTSTVSQAIVPLIRAGWIEAFKTGEREVWDIRITGPVPRKRNVEVYEQNVNGAKITIMVDSAPQENALSPISEISSESEIPPWHKTPVRHNLSDDEVMHIRALSAQDVPMRVIADQYSISPSTVFRIVHGIRKEKRS